MKKITLLALLFVASIGYSQTVIWEDDFNDEDISDWTLYDEDGDANEWFVVQIEEEDGTPVNTPVLRSASWSSFSGPLTPDNYAVSPAIDLTGEDGTNTITLTWNVSAADAAYSDENYTVYVATGNSVSELTSSSISFNELVSDNGPAGSENFYEKTLDLTSMAGETVYVGFRHHDVTNVFTIEIDDVSVTTEPNASNDQFAAHNFKFYNTTDVLGLSANTNIDTIEIFNSLGQKVGTYELDSMNSEINISNLSSGLFIAKVSIGDSSETFKFVK
ncbi:MAG: T9SS-dependent choice-of-anchor J family protein [Psychroflexus halocasei]|uniref:T9SS-dependent choice-of-anchor J family protein n=1 Tax=Psychroflexus sp. S27 TaxID=1982757 RepID=UPI000C2A9472|nr:choice-of-anchor J domain-containing protein [Psychroflexus sp. S27]PJX23946.1 hypothetical protein CAP47_04445 [Psychroflexus sp. S27]